MESTRTQKPDAPTAAKPAAEKSTAKPNNGARAGVPLFLQPSAGDTGPLQTLQREPEEEQPIQPKFLQRMGEEEEPLQAKFLQRMEEDEEPLQAKFLQRMGEEEEPLQAKFLQRMEEDEEPLQAKFLQRMEEDEEPLQAKKIQPKLVVGAPNDTFEQEADAAADQVMRSPVTPASIDPSPDAPSLQPKSLSTSGTTHLPGKLKTADSGNPLAASVRDRIEPVLGADLGGVRVHNQLADQQAAKSLHAKAFTHQNHIWLGTNQSPNDVKLMAHEATHVVQQTSSSAAVQKLQLKQDTTQLTPITTRPETPPLTPVSASPEQSQIPTSPIASATAPAAPGAPADSPAATPPPVDSLSDTLPDSPADGPEAQPQDVAPTSPDADPAFQAVVGKSKRTAKDQKAHAPAAAESGAAQAAAVSPPSETASNAQANKVGEMEEASDNTPGFNKDAFKKKLEAAIAAAAPKTLEEADDFKKANKLGAAKSQMNSQVSKEKTASQKPLADTTAAPPDTSAVEPKPVTPLPPAPIGKAPGSIGATKAAPKSKGHSEIEAPLQQSSQQLDGQMADANLTESQLLASNEPTFQAAVTAKQGAQTHAAEAGPTYREAETTQLSAAQTNASATARTDLGAMHDGRAAQLRQVAGDQTQTKSKDEAARVKIAGDIQKIYDKTKTKVETRLTELDGKVTTAFDDGAKAAQKIFEDYVAKRMKAYKDERYDGWFVGTGRWVKDKLAGLPDEVNKFYTEGRDLYLEAMDIVIDDVIDVIATELTGAKTDIAKGRKEVEKYVTQLPDDLKKVGEDAAKDIQSEFDSLVESVDSKQNELIDSLAKKYNEKLKAVDERIATMKEANKGLVDKALDAVKGVIEVINKIKNKLLAVLADAAAVIENIIKDPIGFLSNLISGIKQGLDNFVAKIWEHLKAGLIGWLTGAMGSVGITIPEDIFSLSGIFDLVTQILGLTWDYVRSKAVKLMSEPVVAAAEKTFEIFMLIKEKGISGIWGEIREQFSDLKETVMDEIKNMVIVEVIKAGVKSILGLLNPASAFVKACLLIYDIVMFFVNQGSQILELVKAVVDGVKAITSGSVGAMAKAIEGALVKALPVVIGFLAAIASVGDLAGKVQKIVKKIRQRIDKAIDKLLAKAKKALKQLASKKKPEKSGAKKIKEENKKNKPEKITEKDKKKHRKIGKAIKNSLTQEKKDSNKSFEEAHKQKIEDSKTLEDKYQPLLKKGINLDIKLKPVSEDKKDRDIDIFVIIAPNNYEIKFNVEPTTDEAKFKELLYKALEEVAKNYQGGKSSDFENSAKAPVGSRNISEEAITREKSAEGASTKTKIKEERQKNKEAQKASRSIHEKISLAQKQFTRAAQAEFVPNNIFRVGRGSFFVSTGTNYYIAPRRAAINKYSYSLGSTPLAQIIENAINKIINSQHPDQESNKQSIESLEKRIQEVKQTIDRLNELEAIGEENWTEEDRKEIRKLAGKPTLKKISGKINSFTQYAIPKSEEELTKLEAFSLSEEKRRTHEEKRKNDLTILESISSMPKTGDDSLTVLRKMKATELKSTNMSLLEEHKDKKIKISLPESITNNYEYHSAPSTSEEAKQMYQNFPRSIVDNRQGTMFLASLVVEPSRWSVSHITNMLLLDNRSNLDNTSQEPNRQLTPDELKNKQSGKYKSSQVYEHLPMTQRGSDPNKSTAGEYTKSDIKPSNANLPKNVTDRDLAAVQRNATLKAELENFFTTQSTLSDTDIINAFSQKIADYLGIPKSP